MLELKKICYDVETETGIKHILNGIDLQINERFVAFTGPNGGGKSTLAKIIMGLEKPTSGQILLDGEDVTGLSVYERARKGICYAFQQPVKFKGITVGDLMSAACGKKMAVSQLCEFLSEVGLCAKEYIGREVDGSLSGGELKRIEIATALARKAELTIFDEPEAGIDLWSFDSLVSVFESIMRNSNDTVLVISHQERLLKIAKRIIVVANGQITQDGTPDVVLPSLFTKSVCSAITEKR